MRWSYLLGIEKKGVWKKPFNYLLGLNYDIIIRAISLVLSINLFTQFGF